MIGNSVRDCDHRNFNSTPDGRCIDCIVDAHDKLVYALLKYDICPSCHKKSDNINKRGEDDYVCNRCGMKEVEDMRQDIRTLSNLQNAAYYLNLEMEK